jgi:dipicolinate synthase subunit A
VRLCKSKKIHYIDIYEDSQFVDINTKISAEGTLYELMSVLDIMLNEAAVGIIGYGRLGLQMAKLLLFFGTKVCVMARREDSLIEAKAIGCDTMLIEKTSSTYTLKIPDYPFDVIINTVEHPLFTEQTQKFIKGNPIFFELASGKGGFSEEFTNNKNYKIIRPGSIPLKYAPKTAAYEYTNCIKQLIEKGG